ncbi:STAS domain-containing protein [bacterium]|nr:STAS domain-containing protein [bacterium]
MNSRNPSRATCFTVREVEPSPEGVRIHRLGGIFTNEPRTYEFLEDLRADLKESADTVVLDLGDVVHLTSGGIGVLAALYSAARDAGRSFRLAAPGPRTMATLRVSRLLPIIPTFDSVEDALVDDAGNDSDATRTGTD